MKSFFTILISVALFLVSCSDKEECSEFTLEYDTPSLTIPSGGGQFQLSLHWTECKLKVSVNESFVVPSILNVGSETGEGTVLLTFTVAENPYYSAREARISFEPETAGAESRELVLTQEGLGSEQVSVSVNPGEIFQSWDGFGAMNLGTNWKLNTFWTEDDASALLGDMGLTIMRIRIPSDESRWEAIAADCSAIYSKYGTKILATPWSMPTRMKTPAQLEAKKDGVTSSLKSECYEEYARYLERFAALMKEKGAPVEAISIQNEPDYAAGYDGCIWSAEQHLDFIRDYGHLIQSAALVTAESFSSRQAFYAPALEDETACGNIDIVGGHLYGATPSVFDLAVQKGKRLWMTEHLLNDSWTKGTDHWEETLDMLAEINQCIACGWNAYIWWYGCRYYSLVGDGEEGTTRSKILPRGYAYAHYSKYIRPGDVHIGASSGSESLLCTAFQGGEGLSIVLVNTDKTMKELTLDAGVTVASADAIYTSRDANFAKLPTSADGSAVKLNLPGESVATLLISI